MGKFGEHYWVFKKSNCMNFNKIVPLLFIILFTLNKFHALGSVYLSENYRRNDISKQFEIFEDKENKISYLEIISGKFESNFLSNNIETKFFNRHKRTFWVRLKTVSQTDKKTEWLLRFWNYYSLIDCYTVYSNGRTTVQTSGWSLGLNERSEKNAEILFRILLEARENATVYLHITTDPVWNNPPEIRSEIISSDAWTTIERNHWLLNGLMAGLVIIVTVFAFLNFLYGRKLYLLSLAISNLVILFYFLNSNNIISTFLFSEYPWFTFSRFGLIYFCLPSFFVSIGLLFITFGELNKILPVTSRIYIKLTSLIVFMSIAIPALSLSESLMKYLYFILFGWTIFQLVVWINLARKNNIIGKVALICYTPMGIGLLIEYLRQMYILENNVFFQNAFQVAASMTISISMFTFLNFARKLRKKKIKAQKEKEQLLTEQNILLESSVEQRTVELRIANDNLFSTLENLKETQSSLIKSEKQKETEIIRSRISQDIHDDISSELTKISWMSEVIKSKSQKENIFNSYELLEKINISSRETISKLGEIIWAIKPENDNLESLLSYIRNHIANFLEGTTIQYKINFPEIASGLNINPELKRNLFLVLKEALNNTVKYSEAKNIEFNFTIENNCYYISITDDGKGIEKNVIQGTGNGLINMKRRIENTGGSFNIKTGKNMGTKIILNGKLF